MSARGCGSGRRCSATFRRAAARPSSAPGSTEWLLGSRRAIAARWAETFGYPMDPNSRDSLPQVAQYVAVDQDVIHHAACPHRPPGRRSPPAVRRPAAARPGNTTPLDETDQRRGAAARSRSRDAAAPRAGIVSTADLHHHSLRQLPGRCADGRRQRSGRRHVPLERLSGAAALRSSSASRTIGPHRNGRWSTICSAGWPTPIRWC